MHTLTVFLAISLYSFQPNPKYDLTLAGNSILAMSTSILVGLVLNIFFKMPLMDNILSGLSAILFAAYIWYDTQKIIGGKNYKYALSQNEYILAALNIYQDVINLFLQILKITAKSSSAKRRSSDFD